MFYQEVFKNCSSFIFIQFVFWLGINQGISFFLFMYVFLVCRLVVLVVFLKIRLLRELQFESCGFAYLGIYGIWFTDLQDTVRSLFCSKSRLESIGIWVELFYVLVFFGFRFFRGLVLIWSQVFFSLLQRLMFYLLFFYFFGYVILGQVSCLQFVFDGDIIYYDNRWG